MSFLKKILPAKEAEVRKLKEDFVNSAPGRPTDFPIRDFATAMQTGRGLIAEIKKKSPSHPRFYQPASPEILAEVYCRNGAAALSIVTDEMHFGTSLTDVIPVKRAANLPVLVKDFVIDEVQLLAAWAAGADAILLIVRILNDSRLSALLQYSRQLGLHALVECHDRDDIDRAVKAGATIIGVNNRNLATLTTDLDHGAAMLPGVPQNLVRVSESGLYTRNDITRMAGLGSDAFLVGHALLQSRDPGRKVAELSGREKEKSLRVKTCGITNVSDAVFSHEAGAHILGLIFAPGKRMISRVEAAAIRKAIPKARLCGVFVNEEPEVIKDLALSCGLDLIQLHGDESPSYCQNILSLVGLPLIKALTPLQADLAGQYNAAAYLLVDLPKGADKQGQTPEHCRAAAQKLSDEGHEVFLAGGLTADNVRTACSETQLFAVDVASGVEAAPGLKDQEKIRAFILEATR